LSKIKKNVKNVKNVARIKNVKNVSYIYDINVTQSSIDRGYSTIIGRMQT